MKLFRGRKKSETGTRFKSSQQLFDTASKATAGFTDGVPDKQSNPDAPILVNRSPDSWEQWGCLRCAAARRTLRAAHCTRTAVLLSGRSTTISSCLRQDWNTTTSSVVFRGGAINALIRPFYSAAPASPRCTCINSPVAKACEACGTKRLVLNVPEVDMHKYLWQPVNFSNMLDLRKEDFPNCVWGPTGPICFSAVSKQAVDMGFHPADVHRIQVGQKEMTGKSYKVVDDLILALVADQDVKAAEAVAQEAEQAELEEALRASSVPEPEEAHYHGFEPVTVAAKAVDVTRRTFIASIIGPDKTVHRDCSLSAATLDELLVEACKSASVETTHAMKMFYWDTDFEEFILPTVFDEVPPLRVTLKIAESPVCQTKIHG